MDAPLVFDPLLKVRVWGGEALKVRADGAFSEPVGESWEVADHGEDTTCVREGPHAGRSLHDLFVADPEGLCGKAVDPANPQVFPLLLKLIDAQQDLSVQVHPDDSYAGRQSAGELGKTEAWYVLGADPGGKLYRGMKPGVGREEFASALANGTVAELLHGFEVSAGDVIHIPAGTIHALGAGVRIVEIQQNSDTTYRVFDWNRVGLDGKPRELHVEHALAVSNFRDQGSARQEGELLEQPGCVRERFVACDKFNFERLRSFQGRPVRLDTEKGCFHLLTVTVGKVKVTCAGGTVSCGQWDTCLVPAGAGEYSLSPSEEAEVLLFYRP